MSYFFEPTNEAHRSRIDATAFGDVDLVDGVPFVPRVDVCDFRKRVRVNHLLDLDVVFDDKRKLHRRAPDDGEYRQRDVNIFLLCAKKIIKNNCSKRARKARMWMCVSFSNYFLPLNSTIVIVF